MRKSDLKIPMQRSFSLNSQEFYEAVCAPAEQAWIPNGALPLEPQRREAAVIVEVRKRQKRS